jgi:hypothetical protein
MPVEFKVRLLAALVSLPGVVVGCRKDLSNLRDHIIKQDPSQTIDPSTFTALSSRAPPAQDPKQAKRAAINDTSAPVTPRVELECIWCLEEVSHIALIPCGHVPSCDGCKSFLKDLKLCPTCRQPFTSTLRLYF